MQPIPQIDVKKLLVAMTTSAFTAPCVNAARRLVEQAGHQLLEFSATGAGGMKMEALIKERRVHGVLDLTTMELASHLVGGPMSAGPDRLTAAGTKGVCQVLSLGGLDMVDFGPTVSDKLKDRLNFQADGRMLLRTSPTENDQLGREIAEKASAARGPTALLVPLRGLSALDKEGMPLWSPASDQALFQSLHNWMAPQVQIVELDFHINDPEFADAAVRILLKMLLSTPMSKQGGS
jgi:uncharacterized protein (UPF0261 family)